LRSDARGTRGAVRRGAAARLERRAPGAEVASARARAGRRSRARLGGRSAGRGTQAQASAVAAQRKRASARGAGAGDATRERGRKILAFDAARFSARAPELVVNIHIYAPREADRILYINNRQYHAGDRVRDDIVVEDIVQDGAVLSFRGQRFKLPRPS